MNKVRYRWFNPVFTNSINNYKNLILVDLCLSPMKPFLYNIDFIFYHICS